MPSLLGSSALQGQPCPLLLEAGVAEPEGELEKAACIPTSVVLRPITHGSGSWSWRPQGCFLDAPEPHLLCGDKLTMSTQLELWGKDPFSSDCPIHGRTTSGNCEFSANSAGLPTSQSDLLQGARDSLGMFSVAPPPFQSQLASSS